jgi:restriction system protein
LSSKSSEASMFSSPPLCPLCSAPMRLRTAKQGKNAGNQFWGCSKYPECKGTRQSEAGGH